jgi:carboxypeptidase family protein
VRPRPPSIAILGLLGLSGCLGGGPASVHEGMPSTPLTAAPALFDEDTCGVSGSGVDEEERPLADVGVSILGPEMRSTRTAADGSFSFSLVPPGRYQAAAKHPAYEFLLQGFDCVAGASANVTLRLKLLPPPSVPRVAILQSQHGRVGCSVGTVVTSTGAGDVCSQFHLDTTAKSRLLFGIDNDTVTAAVYEVEWKPNAGLASGHVLSMIYPSIQRNTPANVTTPNRHTANQRAVTGPSPLHVEIVGGNVSRSLYAEKDHTNVTLEVRAGADNASAFGSNPFDEGSTEVVYQQDFTAYAAVFYDGLAVPAGFTMRPT